MTTYATHLAEAIWALRYLLAAIAALTWFACRVVEENRRMNARIDAAVAERETAVSTWDAAGRLTSVGGQLPDAWLEQQRGRS